MLKRTMIGASIVLGLLGCKYAIDVSARAEWAERVRETSQRDHEYSQLDDLRRLQREYAGSGWRHMAPTDVKELVETIEECAVKIAEGRVAEWLQGAKNDELTMDEFKDAITVDMKKLDGMTGTKVLVDAQSRIEAEIALSWGRQIRSVEQPAKRLERIAIARQDLGQNEAFAEENEKAIEDLTDTARKTAAELERRERFVQAINHIDAQLNSVRTKLSDKRVELRENYTTWRVVQAEKEFDAGEDEAARHIHQSLQADALAVKEIVSQARNALQHKVVAVVRKLAQQGQPRLALYEAMNSWSGWIPEDGLDVGELKKAILTQPVEYFSQPRQLELGNAARELDRLAGEEVVEQLRDWAMLSVFTALDPAPAQASLYLGTRPPLRTAEYRETGQFAYGPGRVAMLSESDCLVLVPTSFAADDSGRFAAGLYELVDQRFVVDGKHPVNVFVAWYSLEREDIVVLESESDKNPASLPPDADASPSDEQTDGNRPWIVTLERVDAIDGEALYSNAHGFVSNEVSQPQALEQAFSQIDSFLEIEADQLNETVKISGRRYRDGTYAVPYQRLTLDDARVIHAAVFEADLKAKYVRKVLEQSMPGFNQMTPRLQWQRVNSGLEAALRDPVTRQFLNEAAAGDSELAFSLDPWLDSDRLLENMVEAGLTDELENDRRFRRVLVELNDVGAFQIPDRAAGDSTGLFSYLEEHADGFLGEELQSVVSQSQFQAPRYEGGIEGTEVGMTFFYTDLIAKLLGMRAVKRELSVEEQKGFDEQLEKLVRKSLLEGNLELAPEEYLELTKDHYTVLNVPDVPGFIPCVELTLTGFQQEETRRNPEGRLWWGINPDAVTYDRSNGLTRFAPQVMRLHMRSKASQTAVEVRANPQFGMYCSSFNRRFSGIARFEPEFQRLNCIFALHAAMKFASQFDRSDAWSFLSGVDLPAKTLTFRRWYKQALASDRTRIELSMPYVELVEAPDDAMLLFSSRPDARGEFIRGGVTGPSWNQLLPSVVRSTGRQRSGVPAEFVRQQIDRISSGLEIPVKGDGKFHFDRLGRSSATRIELPSSARIDTEFARPVRSETARVSMRCELQLERQPITGGTRSNIDFSVEQVGDKLRANRLSLDLPVAVGEPMRLNLENGSASEMHRILHNLSHRDAIDGTRRTRVDQKDIGRLYVEVKDGHWLEVTRRTKTTDREGVRYGQADADNWLHGQMRSTEQLPANLREVESGRKPWKVLERNEDGEFEFQTVWMDSSVPGRSLQLHLAADQSVAVRFARSNLDLGPLQFLLSRDLKLGQKPVVQNDAATEALSAIVLQRMTESLEEGIAFTAARDRNGKLALLSREGQPPESRKTLEQLLPDRDGLVVAVRREKGGDVRVRPDGILEVPADLSSVHEKVIRDIAVLSPRQRAQYDEFHRVTPKEDTAVISLRLQGEGRHALIRKGAAPPENLELTSLKGRQVEELETTLREFYTGGRKDLDFKEATRPYFEALQEIAGHAGFDPKRIVVAEDPAINASVIWKLHGGDSQVKFMHDQPDVARSIDNAETSVTPEISATRIVITEDVELTPELIEDIESYVVRVYEDTTVGEFYNILQDQTARQIVLIAAVEDGHIQFKDKALEIEVLTEGMGGIAKFNSVKDSMMIVSNDPAELARRVNESGLFRRVSDSTYDRKDSGSLKRALQHVRRFFSSFSTQRAQFSSDAFDTLLQEIPDETLRKSVRKASQSDGDSVELDTARLSRRERSQLPDETVNEIRRAMLRTEGNQSMDAIIDGIQEETIKSLPLKPNDVIRSIPRLKVECRPSQLRGLSYA